MIPQTAKDELINRDLIAAVPSPLLQNGHAYFAMNCLFGSTMIIFFYLAVFWHRKSEIEAAGGIFGSAYALFTIVGSEMCGGCFNPIN